MHVAVSTYDDDPAPVCVRFDSRGTRLTLDEARDLVAKLTEALRDYGTQTPAKPSSDTSAYWP